MHTPTSSATSLTNFSSIDQNPRAGGHKRIPSFIKSIPLTKVNKSPNSLE